MKSPFFSLNSEQSKKKNKNWEWVQKTDVYDSSTDIYFTTSLPASLAFSICVIAAKKKRRGARIEVDLFQAFCNSKDHFLQLQSFLSSLSFLKNGHKNLLDSTILQRLQ